MNKEQIIDRLNQWNFDKKDYMLVAAAALVFYGIKETTNDIDMSVSDELYEKLITDYKANYVGCDIKGYKLYRIDGDIEDELDFGKTFFNFEEKEIIDGIQVQTLENIIKFKKIMNREKDLKDIKLIEDYIKNNNQINHK